MMILKHMFGHWIHTLQFLVKIILCSTSHSIVASLWSPKPDFFSCNLECDSNTCIYTHIYSLNSYKGRIIFSNTFPNRESSSIRKIESNPVWLQSLCSFQCHTQSPSDSITYTFKVFLIGNKYNDNIFMSCGRQSMCGGIYFEEYARINNININIFSPFIRFFSGKSLTFDDIQIILLSPSHVSFASLEETICYNDINDGGLMWYHLWISYDPWLKNTSIEIECVIHLEVGGSRVWWI